VSLSRLYVRVPFEEERDPPAGHDDTLDEIKVTTQNREKKSVLRLKP
jgi:hypothetical protein